MKNSRTTLGSGNRNPGVGAHKTGDTSHCVGLSLFKSKAMKNYKVLQINVSNYNKSTLLETTDEKTATDLYRSLKQKHNKIFELQIYNDNVILNSYIK